MVGDSSTLDLTLGLDGLQSLIDLLAERGFTVLGPTVRDDAIGYAPITSLADLPAGVGDEQGPAHYRLTARADDALFGYAAGAQSAKPVLFPADQLLWRSRRSPDGPVIEDPAPTRPCPPYALIGLRSCDLQAIALHDRILLERFATDVHYAAARADCLIVAVTCTDPAGTCFCASMGTGPAPGEGCDIALTELYAEGAHRFVARAGSSRGAELLQAAGARPAGADDVSAARRVTAEATRRMGRELDTDGLKDVLYTHAKSSHWDQVAARCLACTNCTLVCPTCFCTSVTDATDLSGDQAERHRVWDSCFSREYSYIHGGSVRESVRSRYRQWITHKLASWQDQFGSSGCVGCGRCVTWCPAGIDITAEAAALRRLSPASDQQEEPR